MLRALLPLALIATAGTAYAQTMSTPAPAPSTPGQTLSTPATSTQPMPTPSQTMSNTGQPMSGSSAGAIDANGQPIIGRNDWVRQPGDRQAPGAQSPNRDPNMAAAPPARPRMSGASQPGPDGTFRDEFGFRYDAQGNRIDARGRIIAPPMSRQ